MNKKNWHYLLKNNELMTYHVDALEADMHLNVVNIPLKIRKLLMNCK
jgi:hypothetical protein